VIARRPAVPVAVLFVIGISLHATLPPWEFAWLAAILLLLVDGFTFRHRASLSSIFIAAATLVSGLCAGQLAEFHYPRDHIAAFAGDESGLASVEGRIEETPKMIEAVPGGRPMPDKQIVALSVGSVRTWNGWIPASGELPVTISPPVLDLAAGQTVRLLGRIDRPRPAMNPGGFNGAEYDRRQRILVSMYVSRPYDVQVISRPARFISPMTMLRDASRRLLDRGFDSTRDRDRSLLRALIFGDREPALRNVSDDFIRAGGTHVLASNGARIAMLSAIGYLLLRLLRLPPRLTLATVTTLITLFGFLTMPASQAIRPVIVCVAIGFGLLGKRPADALQLLALAALALLVGNPSDLYSAGLQMSFVIVLGLILFARPLSRFLHARLENVDKKVARSFLPQTTARRAREQLGRWMFEATVAAAVAFLVAIPLAAYHFEQFNPWTVPFGVVLSPLALLALIAGFIKIALTAICPAFAATWASIAWLPTTALRHTVHWLATVPGADLPMSRPSILSIAIYYTLLALPLLSWTRRPVRWCARCAPAGACVMLVVLPLCGGFAPMQSGATGVKITLLSVGAGQCAVVEPWQGRVMLLDAGSSNVTDPLRNCVEPFLRHEQCSSIDSIWLSHGDYDHISAVGGMMTEYGVREVVTSPSFRRHAHESKPCASLLQTLDNTHHSPHQVVAGGRTSIGAGVEVEVLWPPSDCTFNSNNAGMVLRLTCAGRSILFPADIQEPAERELLKHPEKLRSDILIAPHHGSSEASTPEFIAAVDPKVILASNESRLTMKQRIFDTETRGRPFYRTSRFGAITVEILRDGTIRLTPYINGPPITLPPLSR
jgi:competence protein ComEC